MLSTWLLEIHICIMKDWLLRPCLEPNPSAWRWINKSATTNPYFATPTLLNTHVTQSLVETTSSSWPDSQFARRGATTPGWHYHDPDDPNNTPTVNRFLHGFQNTSSVKVSVDVGRVGKRCLVVGWGWSDKVTIRLGNIEWYVMCQEPPTAEHDAECFFNFLSTTNHEYSTFATRLSFIERNGVRITFNLGPTFSMLRECARTCIARWIYVRAYRPHVI